MSPSPERPPLSATLRGTAIAAPACLLTYGVLRLVDGLDGSHGPGLAWCLGHTSFLVAFVLFAALVVELRGVLPATGRWRAVTAGGATAAALFGGAAFIWVIVGDLFPSVDETAPLPDPLYTAGPLLFQAGLMTLLVLAATARPRILPPWSPPVTFLGFVPIAVNLDLLPLGALLIPCGLAPLRPSARSERAAHPGVPGRPS